jgi:hypothetical protein
MAVVDSQRLSTLTIEATTEKALMALIVKECQVFGDA